MDFRLFESDDLEFYAAWFEDELTHRFISKPDDAWLTYIKQRHIHVFVAEIGKHQKLAVFQMDVEPNGVSYCDIVVNPKLRSKGLGTTVMRAFLTIAAKHCVQLIGKVEKENSASIRMLEKLGFDCDRTIDGDGLLTFSQNLR